MNTFEKYSKAVEGYSNGYKFDEFKKGETCIFGTQPAKQNT
ncbi:hypothetical protein [Cytobacillus depressus]|nr:hypothetical protein [Cytobacillus depressus]